MRITTRLKSSVVFGQTNSPLSTARVLIDAVGYVCSESVKCDDCLPKTLGDELTLSLAVTLNQDWSIEFDIFVISSQTLASSFRQSNCIHCDKNLSLYCH